MTKKTFIFGLGNPGEGFRFSRHNVGHQFLDFLRLKLGYDQFSEKKKLGAFVSTGEQLVLVKPTTYMNLSGDSVLKTLNFFIDGGWNSLEADGLLAHRLIVVHDDLDLNLGSFKIQKGVGPKQHNGLLSIYRNLGTSDFWHVRIGIDNREGSRDIPPDRYVLQEFSSSEKSRLNSVFAQLLKRMHLSGLLQSN